MKLTTSTKTEAQANIERIVNHTGLSEGLVQAVLGDLANQKNSKETQAAIATRYGLRFGQISSIRNMGKITIEEIRAGSVTTSIVLMETAKGLAMDKLNDPAAVAKMSAKDLSTIAKQQADMALNMSNNAVGQSNVTINNIGDVKMLMEMRTEANNKSAAERLAERGVNVEKILSRNEPEPIELSETESNNEATETIEVQALPELVSEVIQEVEKVDSEESLDSETNEDL